VINKSASEYPDIFAEMHKLESVSITSVYCMDVEVESIAGKLLQKWLSSLFANNPQLNDVYLHFPVSDETLILCSNLTNLQTAKFSGHGYTITGIRALLRGSSRKVIREIRFKVDSGIITEVEQEIGTMESERGVTFNRNHEPMTSDLIYYDLKFRLP
jgi:hypothetical protein